MPANPKQTSNVIRRVHDDLKKRILSGKWSEGEKLPTTEQLAVQYDCSVGAASKAIALLAHAGMVEQKKRSGTRVTAGIHADAEKKVDAFAFIYPSERHEGIWRTIHGFEEAAREKKYRVMMLTAGPDVQKEIDMLGRISEFDVKGVAIHPTLTSTAQQNRFSNALLASSFPIVLAGVNVPGVGCPSVTTDGFHAGYTVTKHLLDGGLKRIGFFTDHAYDVSMRDRYQGYRWALREAGIEETKDWVYLRQSMQPDYENPLRNPIAMAREYLQLHGKKIEGVTCSHDFLGVGMIHAARELGLRVPEDLKVAGIDGHQIGNSNGISLTTYAVSSEMTGRKTFELLEALSSGAQNIPTEIQVRGEMVIRDSTRMTSSK